MWCVRRLLRILLNVATLLSALLCVVMAGLWVRSATSDGRREDWVFAATPGSGWPRLAIGRIEFGTLGPPEPIVGRPVVWGTGGPAPLYPDFASYALVFYDDRIDTWTFGGFERREGRAVVKPSRPPSYVGPLPMTVRPFKVWFVPYWFPVLCLSSLPAMHGVRLVRHFLRARRRRLTGLCPQCGYDCRATPERCPECGAVSAAIAQGARLPGPGG
jgi:hypothetical protein